MVRKKNRNLYGDRSDVTFLGWSSLLHSLPNTVLTPFSPKHWVRLRFYGRLCLSLIASIELHCKCFTRGGICCKGRNCILFIALYSETDPGQQVNFETSICGMKEENLDLKSLDLNRLKFYHISQVTCFSSSFYPTIGRIWENVISPIICGPWCIWNMSFCPQSYEKSMPREEKKSQYLALSLSFYFSLHLFSFGEL